MIFQSVQTQSLFNLTTGMLINTCLEMVVLLAQIFRCAQPWVIPGTKTELTI